MSVPVIRIWSPIVMLTGALVTLAGVTGCAETPADGAVELQILLASGDNPLYELNSLVLKVGDQAETALRVSGGQILLDAPLALAPDAGAHIALVGRDSDGVLIARGESAPVGLVAGGLTRVDVVLRPTGSFSGALAALAPRVDCTLAPAIDGGTWLVGGRGPQLDRAGVEYIDPWTSRAEFPLPELPEPRRAPVVFQAADGAVVVAFGRTDVADVVFARPGDDAWTRTSLSGVSPVRFSAFVPEGAGGWVVGGAGQAPTDQVVRLDYSAGSATARTLPPLGEPRLRPLAHHVDDRLLVIGGGTRFGEWYSPVDGTSAPVQGAPVVGHAMLTLADGALILGGGTNAITRVTPVGEVLPAGALRAPRQNATAHWLSVERFVVVGGQGSATDAEVVAWDGQTATSLTTVSLGAPRVGHDSIRIERAPYGPHVLVVGGLDEYGVMTGSAELFIP